MNDNFFTVIDLPEARAIVTFDDSSVFREESEITPVSISDELEYMPWGGDNRMPYKILSLFEEDETLAACQMFNSEVCYAGGLRLEAPNGVEISQDTKSEVDNFFLDNNIPYYFLGTCKDLKYYEFAVTVLIFSNDKKKITNIFRKEALHCRFVPAEKDGYIPYVLYADWRDAVTKDKVEKIHLIDPRCPLTSINKFLESNIKKMAFVTRIPTVDSFYYPIPTYAALFKGKWFNIKRYIGAAKEAKLKNSAPIKYLIEISNEYFEKIYESEHIIDPVKRSERMVKAKQEMIDFLTGAENSGKAFFSLFANSFEGKEMHYVKITKIETSPQGGDWETDHQEAVNMLCFAMRVHSNLVGSVPGKSNSNNSGSDKRELYTIAQAVQRPYHDIIFHMLRILVQFNGWNPLQPVVPYIQLTTLDSHKDFTQVKDNTED